MREARARIHGLPAGSQVKGRASHAGLGQRSYLHSSLGSSVALGGERHVTELFLDYGLADLSSSPHFGLSVENAFNTSKP